jgi:hypothetical protein
VILIGTGSDEWTEKERRTSTSTEIKGYISSTKKGLRLKVCTSKSTCSQLGVKGNNTDSTRDCWRRAYLNTLTYWPWLQKGTPGGVSKRQARQKLAGGKWTV